MGLLQRERRRVGPVQPHVIPVEGVGAEGDVVDPDEVLTWTPTEPGGGPVIVRDISLASICATLSS